MLSSVIFVGYGAGAFLMADAIANINTAGHAWGVEFMVAGVLLFAGALAHLASKVNN